MMMNRPSRRSSNGTRSAFTLVEMLIVIGIVVLLAALVVAVSAGLSRQSEVRETEMLFERMNVMLQEWETAADRELRWGEDGKSGTGAVDSRAKYDLQLDTPHIMVITEMLRTVARPKEVRDHIAQFKPEQVFRYGSQAADPPWLMVGDPQDPDPQCRPPQGGGSIPAAGWLTDPENESDDNTTILDAWQLPVRVVHPGRLWLDDPAETEDRDDDGTIRTPLERIYGVARNAKLYFVSAGPDGKFGNRDPDAGVSNDVRDYADDNVFSYEVKEPPQP